MKAFFNCLLLLTLLAISAPLILSQGGIDGEFTPAEARRNAQRKALGLPPIKPKAARRPVVPPAGRVLNFQEPRGRAPMGEQLYFV